MFLPPSSLSLKSINEKMNFKIVSEQVTHRLHTREAGPGDNHLSIPR